MSSSVASDNPWEEERDSPLRSTDVWRRVFFKHNQILTVKLQNDSARQVSVRSSEIHWNDIGILIQKIVMIWIKGGQSSECQETALRIWDIMSVSFEWGFMTLCKVNESSDSAMTLRWHKFDEENAKSTTNENRAPMCPDSWGNYCFRKGYSRTMWWNAAAGPSQSSNVCIKCSWTYLHQCWM